MIQQLQDRVFSTLKISKDQLLNEMAIILVKQQLSEYSMEVLTLRAFRDNYLMTSNFGRIIVKIYYVISPSLASFISKKEPIKQIVKCRLLDPIVKYLNK